VQEDESSQENRQRGADKTGQEMDAHFLDVKKRRELKRNYLSTLSTRFNPDILVGGAGEKSFIRGTEYYSKAGKAEAE